METAIEIPQEKKWAQGMSQQDFEHEFMRRNPKADVIPNVKVWTNTPITTYSGIDPIQSEDYEIDDQPGAVRPKNEPEKIATDAILKCRGCGKECKGRFGLQAHERHCKMAQNLKSNG